MAGYVGGIGYQLANGLRISARYNSDFLPTAELVPDAASFVPPRPQPPAS